MPVIRNRQDYRDYREADRIALRKKKLILHEWLFRLLCPDYIWNFQKLLRKTEYHLNCGHRLRYLLAAYQLRRYYWKFAFYIPPNSFGPGLNIIHFGGIYVWNAKVGKNCRLYQEVTIGTTPSTSKSPVIGDNVMVGAGAKIMGDVSIADDIAIGANAVVVDSFDEPGITVAGIPAKKVSDRGSQDYIDELAAWAERDHPARSS